MHSSNNVFRVIKWRPSPFPNSIFIIEDLKCLYRISKRGYKSYADTYFQDDALMKEVGIVASCDLDYTDSTMDGVKGQYYFPNATYVHPDFRERGLGIELYLLCLEAIKSNQIADISPMLVPHELCEVGAKTSVAAMRIYKSLVKRKYLQHTKRDNIYQIKKFPSLSYLSCELSPTEKEISKATIRFK